MNNSGYVEVDHIADLAIRVWGQDFYTILARAAEGLYTIMGVMYDTTSQSEKEIIFENLNLENLLVDFLNEILYLGENNHLFLDSMRFVERNDAIVVKAKTHMIQHIEREIKAVTYHELEIIENEKGLETTITFDI